MDLNGDEDFVPKTDEEKKENQKPQKRKMSKEEIANWYREYYAKLATIYPVENFEIQGKNGETLYFYRGNGIGAPRYMVYFLRDENFKQGEAQRVARHLQGEELENEEEDYKLSRVYKASITIDKEEKSFSFLVDWNYRGNGYGRAIYNNYLEILETLGIEDKEQYELQVGNQANHIFFKNMHTEELVARTTSEPDQDEAMSILSDFGQYPNTVRLRDVNAIVDYAIKSNVPMEEISQALNQNGFNIHRDTVRDEELERFRAFGLTGLKATRMHKHFMESKGFEFMQLITDADKEDTTLEFRRIFEEIKKERKEREEEDKYLPDNLKKFGELEHIILDWKYPALLFKAVAPELQQVVKGQAIGKFDEFDPEHRCDSLLEDQNSRATLIMLRDAGLMDKEAYIALYQKALNRNYDLREFDDAVAWRFIEPKPRAEARQEIAQNVYYPHPKKTWQKSRSWGEGHRIAKVAIPQEVSKQGNVRDILKQAIMSKGIAKTTKIKTDMTGKRKDGKRFVVDNLKDWLFGVPGTHGNLQFMGTSAVTFPPQTPKFAVDLVEEVLNGLVHPGAGEGRDD